MITREFPFKLENEKLSIRKVATVKNCSSLAVFKNIKKFNESNTLNGLSKSHERKVLKSLEKKQKKIF